MKPVALITGSASGIGRATALELSRRGHNLILVDVQEQALAEAAQQVRAAGARVWTQTRDLSDKQQVLECASEALEQAGKVDLLFNNAGVMYMGRTQDMKLSDWEWIVDVNLWAPVRMTHALLPHMLERGSGHIAVTASTAGIFAMPHLVAYTLTKHALVGMCESLALEVESQGVDVTVVTPGQISTGLVSGGRFDSGQRASGAIKLLSGGRGYPLDRAGVEIAEGLLRRQKRIHVGREVKPLWLMKRLSPALSHRAGKLMLTQMEKLTTGGDAR